MVANGNIDVYPRIGPTSEWDTAAGHAIIKYAGGVIVNFMGQEITYNKENLINPNFIAGSSKMLALEIKKMIKNEE
jgi:3'(2'), 5'-bisphosphate nucleotidase